jgi:hypothetical protein
MVDIAAVGAPAFEHRQMTCPWSHRVITTGGRMSSIRRAINS